MSCCRIMPLLARELVRSGLVNRNVKLVLLFVYKGKWTEILSEWYYLRQSEKDRRNR